MKDVPRSFSFPHLLVDLPEDGKVLVRREDFKDLHDYSCSLPTGFRAGWRWKRRRVYEDESKGWWLADAVPANEPGFVNIVWREIVVLG